jgi:Protein of unknown function (DUF3467)
MATDQENKQLGPMDTAGIPSIYCNVASVTVSFGELRLYLGEAGPKQVALELSTPKATETVVTPRVCIVLSPEFSRSLRDALSRTIEIYEKKFGQLRPEPTPEQIKQITSTPT